LDTYYDTTSLSTPITNFLNMFDSSTNQIQSAIATAISAATGVTLLSGVY
jgi:hypothetical protein